MKWIGWTATLAAGVLLTVGCRPRGPEPSGVAPANVPANVPADEPAVQADAPQAGGQPTLPEPAEASPGSQETPTGPAEDAHKPVDGQAGRQETVGGSIADGVPGAVGKALWRSLIGQPEQQREE